MWREGGGSVNFCEGRVNLCGQCVIGWEGQYKNRTAEEQKEQNRM